MAREDIELMAHLMRRAGFGASYQELESRVAKGYEVALGAALGDDLDWPIGVDGAVHWRRSEVDGDGPVDDDGDGGDPALPHGVVGLIDCYESKMHI